MKMTIVYLLMFQCKAAFMKAHPGYKWCGSSKQNLKPMSPTVTTRTKLPLTPPSDSAPEVRLAGQDKTGNSRSHMGITPGKLAGMYDPFVCAGFFHKIFGGGALLSGTIFGSRWGRSQMGEGRGGLASGMESGGGTWKYCPLRPKMPLTAKLKQILVF